MSLKKFFKSKFFLYQVLLAIIVTVVLVYIAMYSLRVYTNHGESLAVPDFQGMSMQQMEEVLKEKNLHYEVMDSVYNEEIAPGTVIDQSPVAGFNVKEGRTIFVTISAITPELVAMPKLTDISIRQAKSIMQTSGLIVGEVTYVPSEYANLVLSQQIDGVEIQHGEMVYKGTIIDLTVGQDVSGEMTVVPDLAGVILEQATTEIESLNLYVGAVIYDDTVESMEDSLAARVWKQRPEPSYTEDTEQGSSVDLWLTIDEEKLVGELNEEDISEDADTENDFF